MNVLFVTAEAVPFAKTGGLADVAGELPKYLNRNGAETTVIMPLYKLIKDKFQQKLVYQNYYYEDMFFHHIYFGLFKSILDGVTFYFIDNDELFGNKDSLYGYDDDCWRFALFNKAVIQVMKSLNLKVDVIHLHDWHSGMIAPLIKCVHNNDPYFKNIKIVSTIHNPMYQGLWDKNNISSVFGISMDEYYNGNLRYKDCLSFLKSSIVYSDKVTTVSPSHAKELLTPQFGYGLEGTLEYRKGDLVGILNGIDYDSYNPATDKAIFKNFSKYGKEKQQNKSELQKKYGLDCNPDVPLFGFVGRFVWQKGIDFILPIADRLINLGAQLFFLGTGDSHYEQSLQALQARYPGKVFTFIGYNEVLARQIYASCDFLLMPSFIEPCGISQMIAMRYGTVPIVHETGGLKDTVIPYNEYTHEGNGFSFSDSNPNSFLHVIEYAIRFYKDRLSFANIVSQAMTTNFSWDNSASKYIEMYRNISGKK